jgi:hypothetical protein
MSLFNNLEGEVDGYSKKDIFDILCQIDTELGLLGSGKKHWIMDITSVELIDDYQAIRHGVFDTDGRWKYKPKHHAIEFSWHNGYLMATDSVEVYDLVSKLRDIKLKNIGI